MTVSDEFLEYVQEEALSVQVWGHKSAGFGSTPTKGAESDLDVQNLNAAKTRSLQDRWAEVIRRLEMWVEIHELTDEGEYAPVEVQKALDVPCAGVYQLRQVSLSNECLLKLGLGGEDRLAIFSYCLFCAANVDF